MLEKVKYMTFKQKTLPLIVLISIFAVYSVMLSVSRAGEVKVSVSVIPEEAIISINEKPYSKGDVYLKPGEYTFSASAEGWKTDTQTLEINQGGAVVNLLPDPESENAKQWLKDNPEIQAERESMGAQRAKQKGVALEAKNPLVALLPVSDLYGPFNIDYGPSETEKGSIFLIVSYSTPAGRLNALKWIRQQGQDPTDLEIRFIDFNNPLIDVSTAQNEESEYID